MSQANRDVHQDNTSSATGSTTKRAADALHEGIDKAAEKGEKWEKTLHEKSKQAKEKSHELNGTISQMMRDKPWVVLGGAVALGVLIGTLTRR